MQKSMGNSIKLIDLETNTTGDGCYNMNKCILCMQIRPVFPGPVTLFNYEH